MTAQFRGTVAAVLMLVAASTVLSDTARAHPSVALVMDSGGNVYFSDLVRVWVIRPGGGLVNGGVSFSSGGVPREHAVRLKTHFKIPVGVAGIRMILSGGRRR